MTDSTTPDAPRNTEEQLVGRCEGCKHDGPFKTLFPCLECLRNERHYRHNRACNYFEANAKVEAPK